MLRPIILSALALVFTAAIGFAQVIGGGGSGSNVFAISIIQYGASTGATDNTTAIVAAVSAASTGAGNGIVVIPPQTFKVAQTGNLDLSAFPNVTIQCNDGVVGLVPVGTNLTAPCTLLVNPAFSVSLGRNTKLTGVRIVNQNLESTTDPRAAIVAGNAMTGTGLIASANDITLQRLQINGFNQGLYSNNAQRLHASQVYGDDTNGSSINNCNDSCHFDHMNWWPFLVTNTQAPAYSISAITNSGGLFNIAHGASSPNTLLVTGDQVVVSGIIGANQPLGRYTVTVVDSTHFTINSLAYAAGYVSGGTVYLPIGVRHGTAYYFGGPGIGGEYGDSLWEFGHDTCGSVDTQHGPTNVFYPWCDGEVFANAPEPGTTGWTNAGWGLSLVGGAILNKQISVYQNSADSIHRPLTIDNTQIGVSGCLNSANALSGAAIDVVTGAVEVTNSYLIGMVLCGANYAALQLNTGTTLKVSNTDLQTATAFFVTPSTGCPSYFLDGVAGPCAWTPTLTGQSTPGTPTYTTQVASYTLATTGEVNLDINLSVSGLAGAVGTLFVGGIPIAPTIQGGCSLQRAGGFNFAASGTQLTPIIDIGTNIMALFIVSAAGGAGGYVNAAMLAGAGQIQSHCTYH